MEESKSLQLDDKIDLHRKGWRLQSILWILIALFVLAAGLGLFGGGVLSKQTIGEKKSGVWLEYDRFSRKHAASKLELHLLGAANTPSQIIIPSSYLNKFQIEAITPTPNTIATKNEGIIYGFTAEGPFTVIFHLKPEAIGKVEGNMLLNHQAFHVSHFIYP
jgi:hypothetical protein